jgi:transposase
VTNLLRRRNHLMRKRADLLAHIQNTANQYNLPPLGARVDRKGERGQIPAHFPDPVVRRSVELDLAPIAHYDGLLKALEQELALMAKAHDAFAYHLLRSIPGVGRILTLGCCTRSTTFIASPGCRSFCRTLGSSKPRKAPPARSSATAAKRSVTPI